MSDTWKRSKGLAAAFLERARLQGDTVGKTADPTVPSAGTTRRAAPGMRSLQEVHSQAPAGVTTRPTRDGLEVP